MPVLQLVTWMPSVQMSYIYTLWRAIQFPHPSQKPQIDHQLLPSARPYQLPKLGCPEHLHAKNFNWCETPNCHHPLHPDVQLHHLLVVELEQHLHAQQ